MPDFKWCKCRVKISLWRAWTHTHTFARENCVHFSFPALFHCSFIPVSDFYYTTTALYYYYQPKHLNTSNAAAMQRTPPFTLTLCVCTQRDAHTDFICYTSVEIVHSYTFNPFACHGIYLYDICDIYALLRTLHALVLVPLPVFLCLSLFLSFSLPPNRILELQRKKKELCSPYLSHYFPLCFTVVVFRAHTTASIQQRALSQTIKPNV